MIIETPFKDCFIIKPAFFEDERGSFLLEYNKNQLKQLIGFEGEFVMGNQSISKYGVIRGLHLQKGEFAQAKLVRVIQGKILDVVVDVRINSKTFGKVFSTELSKENQKQILIPRGFLHGFSVLENDTIVAYRCDNYYNPLSEDGVIYNDKKLNIDWKIPKDKIILSKKDMQLKQFDKFII
jgi:dTDP-4-dehydrorhamnose 3,5-epimerase